jgi:hypothetical protein
MIDNASPTVGVDLLIVARIDRLADRHRPRNDKRPGLPGLSWYRGDRI